MAATDPEPPGPDRDPVEAVRAHVDAIGAAEHDRFVPMPRSRDRSTVPAPYGDLPCA